MNKKYTSYVILGVIAMSVLLLSASAAMAGTLTINSNPSGAAVTLGGKNLGTTPVSIDPTAYPSPSFIILSKSGYTSKNVAIYNWMVPPAYTSLSYNLQTSSTTTASSAPAPAPTPAPTSTPAPAPAPAPAPKSGTYITSVPEGAAVYVYLGANHGKYLGTTPFTYDFSAIGPNYIQFVKTGYKFTITKVDPSYRGLSTQLNT